MVTLRIMPHPFSFLILNTLNRGFQIRYHLFQKSFGKVVKIKQTFLACAAILAAAQPLKIP